MNTKYDDEHVSPEQTNKEEEQDKDKEEEEDEDIEFNLPEKNNDGGEVQQKDDVPQEQQPGGDTLLEKGTSEGLSLLSSPDKKETKTEMHTANKLDIIEDDDETDMRKQSE